MGEKNFTIVECAGGVVRNKNRIALIEMKRIDGWGFPKGKIGDNEKPLEAAKREILEETGIKNVFLVRSLGTYQRRAADGKPILLNIHMFLFETEKEKLQPIEDDVRGAQWIFIDDVENYLVLNDDKQFFSLNKKIILALNRLTRNIQN